MSRRKTNPIEDVFRRWMALDTDAQQRVADMVAGFRAADGAWSKIYDVPVTEPRRQRKRKAPATVTVEAAQ